MFQVIKKDADSINFNKNKKKWYYNQEWFIQQLYTQTFKCSSNLVPSGQENS